MTSQLNPTDVVNLVLIEAREFRRFIRLGRIELRCGIVLVVNHNLNTMAIRVGSAYEYMKIPCAVRISNTAKGKANELSRCIIALLKSLENYFPEWKKICGINFVYDGRTRRVRSFCYLTFINQSIASDFISFAQSNWSRRYAFCIARCVTILYRPRSRFVLRELLLEGTVWMSPRVWEINSLIEN
ncbi:hypothetical protein PVAND_014955 [Polypedilum vanderplanki]|uniref:Uncharacterized protein n=1 Tax=Polypedilum vanderplanki TaxID=319348 RepID=A0A9J6BBI0_POLVA|nr:hypothetical protein PVAND_014955 [Polypedilum vanderplanki]